MIRSGAATGRRSTPPSTMPSTSSVSLGITTARAAFSRVTARSRPPGRFRTWRTSSRSASSPVTGLKLEVTNAPRRPDGLTATATTGSFAPVAATRAFPPSQVSTDFASPASTVSASASTATAVTADGSLPIGPPVPSAADQRITVPSASPATTAFAFPASAVTSAPTAKRPPQARPSG